MCVIALLYDHQSSSLPHYSTCNLVTNVQRPGHAWNLFSHRSVLITEILFKYCFGGLSDIIYFFCSNPMYCFYKYRFSMLPQIRRCDLEHWPNFKSSSWVIEWLMWIGTAWQVLWISHTRSVKQSKWIQISQIPPQKRKECYLWLTKSVTAIEIC